MNWDLYRIFDAVASQGSLTAAAEILRLSPPTIARRISELEVELGLRLFERSQDGYKLTDDGHNLRPLADEMARTAEALDRKRLVLQEKAVGTVRIASGYWSGRLIAWQVGKFLRANPSIQIELLASHELANMSRYGADIALRNIRPNSGRFAIRKLCSMDYAVYGAKSYVENHPEAKDERRFKACDWVGLPTTMSDLPSTAWLSERLTELPALRCSQTIHIGDAVRAGVGLGLLPRIIGDEDSTLTRVSESVQLPNRDLWLIVHEDLRDAPGVRAVVDWLVDLFAAVKNENPWCGSGVGIE